MKLRTVILMVMVGAVALWPLTARAWFGEGHQRVARKAAVLPQTLPAFFAGGATVIADASPDPDCFRERLTPQLSRAESPEHYIDLELLKGKPLPPTRYEYIRLCQSLNVAPDHVGTLPYAVTEWTQRLTLAFAQHRKWPGDKAIQSKCLVYAGLLSHYAADLCQPLHCTVHFDGRVDAEGNPAGPKGIHAKVDALLERPEIDAEATLKDLKIEAFPEVFKAVVEELQRSHALVDKVYELEAKLPAVADRTKKVDVAPEMLAFERERLRASVNFVGGLYLTAWEMSATVAVPDWVWPSG
jgi:hypothetical protein